jgi:hypothetical protein
MTPRQPNKKSRPTQHFDFPASEYVDDDWPPVGPVEANESFDDIDDWPPPDGPSDDEQFGEELAA